MNEEKQHINRYIPFWTSKPTILFHKDFIMEWWPTSIMKYEQKVNAITRLIFLLTCIGYVLTMNPTILLVGIITLGVLSLLATQKQKEAIEQRKKESFQIMKQHGQQYGDGHTENGNEPIYEVTSTTMDGRPIHMKSFVRAHYEKGTKKNPMANVLLTDIGDHPERKSAPPSFHPEIHEDITNNIKGMIQELNPEIKNTNKQLFGDLGEMFELEQSNRAFFSTPNSRVIQDEGAFANFLYGDMPSGKDSGIEGSIQRVKDNYRYTMY